MGILITALIVIILALLTYLFNETPFLYKTPSSYKDALPEELGDPAYGPIYIENRNSDAAVVFLHGFKAVPAQFADMAEHFKKEYTVIAPLSPGCATTPEKYMNSYYTQWYAKAKDTYLSARVKYDKVYVVGFSMGAAMALRLAEEYGEDPALKPDKIVSICGLLILNNLLEQGLIYDWKLYFVRFLSWFMPVVKKGPDPDINTTPGLKSYDEAHFLRQVYSMKMGIRKACMALKKVKVPLLLMQGSRDMHSPPWNLEYIRKNVSSEIIRARTFDLSGKEYENTSGHFIMHYPGTRDEVVKEIEEFL